MTALDDRSFDALLRAVASSDPTPGAGPSAAWTCGIAAALVEMVAGVALRHDVSDENSQRRMRAADLRVQAMQLADDDVVAYAAVLAILPRRDEPGHGARLREALSNAADPPAAIAAVAAEVTHLAADAAALARGAVRGEAITAAVLAEAVVRAARRIVELNLASSPDDPRRARVAALARTARADLERATGG